MTPDYEVLYRDYDGPKSLIMSATGWCCEFGANVPRKGGGVTGISIFGVGETQIEAIRRAFENLAEAKKPK